MTATGQLSTEVAPGDRWRRLTTPLLTLGGLATGTAALHVRDPHAQGSWGFCPSRLLFGIDCPGCGGLRSVNDLTNGDLWGAASSNLLFVLLLPVVCYGLARWVLDSWQGRTRVPFWISSRPVFWTLMTLGVAFTVARNTRYGSWLAS